MSIIVPGGRPLITRGSDTKSYPRYLPEKLSELTLKAVGRKQVAPIACDQDMATLQERHRVHTEIWKESRASCLVSDHLIQMFGGKWLDEQPKINSAICLALGTLCGGLSRKPQLPNQQILQNNNRSMGQLVGFESYVKLLRERYSCDISAIYFQDPAFNAVDKAFLEHLGYKVIESPASNDVLTENSFLFAPYCAYWQLYSSIKQAFPALYVGNSLTGHQYVFDECPELRGLVDSFLKPRKTVERVPLSAYWESLTRGIAVRDCMEQDKLHRDCLAEMTDAFATMYYIR